MLLMLHLHEGQVQCPGQGSFISQRLLWLTLLVKMRPAGIRQLSALCQAGKAVQHMILLLFWGQFLPVGRFLAEEEWPQH